MEKVRKFIHENQNLFKNLAEVGLILAWAVWVGRVYFNFNPYSLPNRGNDDFFISIYPYFPLNQLWQCGTCVFWNGLLNGGSPTFSDSLAGQSHPVIALIISAFGVFNGIKVLLILALMTGGVAQWWIAKALKLGWIARLWVAFFGVVAGNLAGPLYGGDVGIVISVAASSLVIAPALTLAQTGKRRDAVILGIMLGQAILSGAGYLQLAIFACVIPALVVFIFDDGFKLKPLWKEFTLALVLAIMLSAAFLLPTASFLSKINKPGDPRTDQPLEYIPINLIARDMKYFLNDSLQKAIAPGIYTLYIGWIPLILAVVAWKLLPREKTRFFLFLCLSSAAIFFLGSGWPLRLVNDWIPSIFSSIRNPGFLLGLAVTLILGLAGWGLDMLVHKDWPRLVFENSSTRSKVAISSQILILPVLLWSISTTYSYNDQFRFLNILPKELVTAAESLRDTNARWIRPLYGNWTFVAVAVNSNVKITEAYRIWDLKDYTNPEYQVDVGNDPAQTTSPDYLGSLAGINFVKNPDSSYAYVQTGQGKIPCQASANGGHISVTCATASDGTFFVLEHNMGGWLAWIDSKPGKLDPGSWLNLTAPSGKHVYEFQFWPVDYLLGLFISILGLILCIWLWRQAPGE